NKQSNTYTLLYIIGIVLVVGTALAIVATTLKPVQQKNADADKMKQILLSVNQHPEGIDSVTALFDSCVKGIVINSDGQIVEGKNAFDINVANESKKPAAERLLPLYIFTDSKIGTKYIIPMNGNGLWGPIWGYIALNEDATTVYGAYFSHQGETPGLGAEIEKPFFSERFKGKILFKDGKFLPIEIVKAGQHPLGDADYVDGISGGTITSKGVGAMLDNCLVPYRQYLEQHQK
ncbi:MAG: NADH:ubiquinone reductase (Na(+)-transporting) subunit C, partial [Muribaculaceae bacterium]|nr:NADH:ubiquinone reductase (Na(+)-transporting) subunit C [Muribaculaceae bacterium]